MRGVLPCSALCWRYMEIILHFALCILHFYKFVMIFRKKEWTNLDFFDRMVRL